MLLWTVYHCVTLWLVCLQKGPCDQNILFTSINQCRGNIVCAGIDIFLWIQIEILTFMNSTVALLSINFGWLLSESVSKAMATLEVNVWPSLPSSFDFQNWCVAMSTCCPSGGQHLPGRFAGPPETASIWYQWKTSTPHMPEAGSASAGDPVVGCWKFGFVTPVTCTLHLCWVHIPTFKAWPSMVRPHTWMLQCHTLGLHFCCVWGSRTQETSSTPSSWPPSWPVLLWLLSHHRYGCLTWQTLSFSLMMDYIIWLSAFGLPWHKANVPIFIRLRDSLVFLGDGFTVDGFQEQLPNAVSNHVNK